MSPSKAEYYRGRAEDCCRNAITAESIDRRLHWLEAAARWISFARDEGVLPPRRGHSSGLQERAILIGVESLGVGPQTESPVGACQPSPEAGGARPSLPDERGSGFLGTIIKSLRYRRG
jgi:hypothetical protein